MDKCLYFSTTAGADVAVSTKGGALVGLVVYGSAAGTTIHVVDSGGDIVCILAASSLDGIAFAPTMPIGLLNGLTITASGTGGYAVFYV